MTVNRTTLLDLPLPVTGTESGTWGDTTNNGLTQYVDIAVAGMNSLTSANFTAGALTLANTTGDSSATNIAAGSAQYGAIKVSSLATNSTITAPSSNRRYTIINADATYSVTIKASGQTGVVIAAGEKALVAFNGTDYVKIATANGTGEFTTVDTTNLEVTNIKAKDGTAAGSIADSTGVVTLASSVLTTTDINGGTIDGTAIGASTPSTGAFTTLSSTGNTTLGNASTDTVQVNGYMGVGGAGSAANAVQITSNSLAGTSQTGLRATPTSTSAATSATIAGYFQAATAAASYTSAAVVGVSIGGANKGAGSTITDSYGLFVNDQTQGTNNYGITSAVSSGTNKWNIYASGTAANYFAGNVLITGTTAKTNIAGVTPQLQINGFTANNASLLLTRNSNDPNPPAVWFGKDRAGAIAQTSDILGLLRFTGFDGTNYVESVQISGSVGASVSSGIVPGVFSIGVANAAGNIRERFVANQTETAINENGDDYDFRVESDTNTHALFVQGSDGFVGIGTSSPSQKLHVSGSGSTVISLVEQTTNGLRALANYTANTSGGTPTSLQLGTYADGGDVQQVIATGQLDIRSGSGADVLLKTNGNTEVARATSNGYLRFASGTGGIQFNGDTAAANALDDYEEGTFTPTIEGTTTAGTGTYTAQVGRYTKIGDRVLYMINLVWSAHTGTGNLRVAGLPFTTESTSNNNNIPAIYSANIALTAGNVMQAYIGNNATTIQLRQLPTGGGADASIPMDTAGQVVLSGQYEV